MTTHAAPHALADLADFRWFGSYNGRISHVARAGRGRGSAFFAVCNAGIQGIARPDHWSTRDGSPWRRDPTADHFAACPRCESKVRADRSRGLIVGDLGDVHEAIS